MQVINECLDDLEKLEGMIDVASEDELNQDDVVFALASIAQSKAIAGLALAIKESGKQDTRRLTTDEASASIPKSQDEIVDFLRGLKVEYENIVKFLLFLHER